MPSDRLGYSLSTLGRRGQPKNLWRFHCVNPSNESFKQLAKGGPVGSLPSLGTERAGASSEQQHNFDPQKKSSPTTS